MLNDIVTFLCCFHLIEFHFEFVLYQTQHVTLHSLFNEIRQVYHIPNINCYVLLIVYFLSKMRFVDFDNKILCLFYGRLDYFVKNISHRKFDNEIKFHRSKVARFLQHLIP